MVEMDPRYHEAKKRLNRLADAHPEMRASRVTVVIGRLWDTALEVDPTGVACVRIVEGLEAKFREAANPSEHP